MRRMIPQKLITAIKALISAFSSLVGKIVYSGGKVKVNGDFEADGITSKGIANTGPIANIGDVAITGSITADNLPEQDFTPEITYTSKLDTPVGYTAMKNIHNVLWFVVHVKANALENVGAEVDFMEATLPEVILAKLIPTSSAFYTDTLCYFSGAYLKTGGAVSGLMGRITKTQTGVKVSLGTNIAVSTGQSVEFDIRIPFIL